MTALVEVQRKFRPLPQPLDQESTAICWLRSGLCDEKRRKRRKKKDKKRKRRRRKMKKKKKKKRRKPVRDHDASDHDASSKMPRSGQWKEVCLLLTH
jgi:hypothetical protein